MKNAILAGILVVSGLASPGVSFAQNSPTASEQYYNVGIKMEWMPTNPVPANASESLSAENRLTQLFFWEMNKYPDPEQLISSIQSGHKYLRLFLDTAQRGRFNKSLLVLTFSFTTQEDKKYYHAYGLGMDENSFNAAGFRVSIGTNEKLEIFDTKSQNQTPIVPDGVNKAVTMAAIARYQILDAFKQEQNRKAAVKAARIEAGKKAGQEMAERLKDNLFVETVVP